MSTMTSKIVTIICREFSPDFWKLYGDDTNCGDDSDDSHDYICDRGDDCVDSTTDGRKDRALESKGHFHERVRYCWMAPLWIWYWWLVRILKCNSRPYLLLYPRYVTSVETLNWRGAASMTQHKFIVTVVYATGMMSFFAQFWWPFLFPWRYVTLPILQKILWLLTEGNECIQWNPVISFGWLINFQIGTLLHLRKANEAKEKILLQTESKGGSAEHWTANQNYRLTDSLWEWPLESESLCVVWN
jgi:hypothetical protein